jgi:hypothetical protein
MKKLVLLTLVMIISIISAPNIQADTTGNITGSITSTGYNNPAAVDYQFLTISRVTWDADLDTETPTVTTALTPQQNYFVDFDVDDLDGFGDLVVEFQFFYHTTSEGNTIEEDFDANSATAVDAFKVIWDNTNGFDSTVTGTSWVFNPAQEGEDPASYYSSTVTGTDISKTFKIYFSPSKVAPASSTGEWVAAVKVYDYIDDTGAWTHGVTDPTNVVFESVTEYTMDWYGEVSHGADTVVWDSAVAGMDYGDGGSEQSYTGMTFFSNDDFYQQVKAGEIWSQTSGAVEEDATLKADPTTANTFGLRAITVGEWYNVSDVQQPALSESSATQVSHVDFENIGGGAYYGRTTESGLSGSITLQLKLSSNFQNGSYEGTITFGITNVVEPV